MDRDSWDQYSRLVLTKLEEQGVDIKSVQAQLNQVDARLAVLESNLKIKTALAGSLFGGLSAAVLKLLGV